jgi:membrane fusion protein (multidrug efflux system)
MSARRALIVGLSLAGLLAVGGYGWYANRAPVGAATPAQAGGSAPVVAVEVTEVATVSMPDEVTAVGTLRSSESVVLRPEVAGRISAIRFTEGAPVTRGQVLVELDAAVQRAELQQAQAALALAEADFRRTEDLFNRKFVSHSARDEAASRREVARAAVALAEARRRRMTLVAPFDGVVGMRNVSVGDYVKDGEELVNLEAISTLKVDFRLPERYLQRLQRGQTLALASDALPGESLAARVVAIDPLVDAQGRSVAVRAQLDNPAGRLRPGLFVRVRLTLEERPAVPVVPEEALMPAAGNVQYVYRVVDGTARRVEVRTGTRRAAQVEIVDGVAPGDVVVTAGHLKLRDGVKVTVVPANGAAAPQGAPAARNGARAG